ncbi:hypothetical protein EMIT0P100_150098 [Pseudomonas sp. IT-P100]
MFSRFAITLWSMDWESEDESVVEPYYRHVSGQLSQACLNEVSGVENQMGKVTRDMLSALLANTSALCSLSPSPAGRILFRDWNESSVTLMHRAVPFTLNSARFDEVRPVLKDRLGIIADAIFEFYSQRLCGAPDD